MRGIVVFRRALLVTSLLAPVGQAQTVDPATGLVIAPGFELVSAQCTVCHSARLVIQNRADRKGWLSMIRWMQEKQGLWALGNSEATMLDYLAANYGPQAVGRRKALPTELLPPAE